MRRPVKKLKFPVNEQAIAERMFDLTETRRSSSYVKQKAALEAELTAFLAELKPPKDIPSCRPSDIVKFLIWKDQAGRTKIHGDQCQYLGLKGRPILIAFVPRVWRGEQWTLLLAN